MGEDSSAPFVERLSPGDAFASVANETRMEILEALADTPDAELGFEELRRKTTVEDPGLFNYHLDKLASRFVEQTTDGDYRLTGAGVRLVGAILSGVYTAELQDETLDISVPCVHCRTATNIRLENNQVRIACSNCEFIFANERIPPEIIARARVEEIPQIIDQWLKLQAYMTMRRFCQNCYGRMHASVTVLDESPSEPFFETHNIDAYGRFSCSSCPNNFRFLLPFIIIAEDSVVGVHNEHGIRIQDTPIWDLPWLDLGIAEIEQRDPVKIVVPLEFEVDRYEVVLDEDLQIERVR